MLNPFFCRSLRSVRRTVLGLAFVGGLAGAVQGDDSVSFSRDVAPVLQEHCVACHSAKKAEGGYRVDTFAELTQAGDSGEAPIDKTAEHLGEMFRRIITDDESERMPAESDPLAAESIELIKRWLASGGEFDGSDPDQLLVFVIPPPQYPDPPAAYPAAVPITAIAFSPDGKEVLAAGYHEVTIWSADDGSLVRRITNLGQRIFAIAIHPDGRSIAVACGEPGRGGEVRLVDYASGEVKAVIARSADVALDLAFRPGTHQLAIGTADSMIRVIDTETLETVRELASHADWVTAVAWSPDGTRLASASRDKSAKVFDAESGELLTSYLGHGDSVRGVMFSADGQHIFSSGTDARLHRWETAGGKRIALIPLGGEGYRLVPGGDHAPLVPLADKRVLQIDPAKNAVLKAFAGLGDWALSVAWHPATERVVAGAYNGEVQLWNAADGQSVSSWIARPAGTPGD